MEDGRAAALRMQRRLVGGCFYRPFDLARDRGSQISPVIKPSARGLAMRSNLKRERGWNSPSPNRAGEPALEATAANHSLDRPVP